MAVLGALLATALLSALGLAIALVAIGESTLASRERTTRALRQAAEGAAYLAVADLGALPSWSGVLADGAFPPLAAIRAQFSEVTVLPPSPWDGAAAIDLRAITERRQAESDADRGPADAAQRWRLFGNAPLERLAPATSSGPWYVAVWVADDRADSDGDPDRDANGVLAVRAEAYGPGDAVAAIEVTVARPRAATGPGGARMLAIRPGS